MEGFFVDLLDRTGQDVNLDGYPEVLVEIGTGGNCLECTRLEILTLRGDGVRSLYDGKASDPVDLDGDGIVEIVRTFDAVGSADRSLAHINQITDCEILAWSGDRYAPRASGYDSYFTARIDGLGNQAKHERGSGTERMFSLAAQTLVLRLKIGDCQAAWTEFRRETEGLESKGKLKPIVLELERRYLCDAGVGPR